MLTKPFVERKIMPDNSMAIIVLGQIYGTILLPLAPRKHIIWLRWILKEKAHDNKGVRTLASSWDWIGFRKSPNSSTLDHSAMLPHTTVAYIDLSICLQCLLSVGVYVSHGMTEWDDVCRNFLPPSLPYGRMGVHGLTTYLHEHTRTLSTPVTFSYPPKNVVSLVVDGWS